MLTCKDTPCFHGGKCTERDNQRSYTCECPAGYTGLNCEKKVDKCTSLQCTNGKTSSVCTSTVDPEGRYNPVVVCSAGGHCAVHGNLRFCSCRSGFTGLRCEININECARHPCANGSTCVDRINDYTCICPLGFTGRHCDRPSDRCASWTCLNGGTCTTGTKGRPSCICPAHYSGPQCQSIDVPLTNTPSPNKSLESGERLSLAAISLGVGLVVVLVLLCMLVVVICHIKKQRNKEDDSETMNNLSKVDLQRENLISTLELKNTNKKVDLEVDCPREKLNRKHINHYCLDYKNSTGYKDELSLLDKDENCEKMTEGKKHLSRMYR